MENPRRLDPINLKKNDIFSRKLGSTAIDALFYWQKKKNRVEYIDNCFIACLSLHKFTSIVSLTFVRNRFDFPVLTTK